MQARGPPKKVSILPQTPGIVLEASGMDSHRSGLQINGKNMSAERKVIENSLPKFISVGTPNRLIPVHGNDRYQHQLSLSYSIERNTLRLSKSI